MSAILLTWNPKKYRWGSLQDELAKVQRRGRTTRSWSVGKRKQIAEGTRFFMVRQGSEPRGLVGAGWTTAEPFNAPHWDHEREARGEEARYVDIHLDVLADLPVIPMRELKAGALSKVNWSTQSSGISIPAHVVTPLEELWASRIHGAGLQPDQESAFDDPKTSKAHGHRATVNKYERCRKLRALCLAHYKLKCYACKTLLSDVYGQAAANVIHVHHLELVSALPDDYEIHPIRDLRPVCPNCHSVIHSRQPHYSIEELQEMLAAARPGRKKRRA
jgi:5-methylcytosine-specific restriction enzyme A